MGLIKTAIIAGAGIYAVNKITKSAEHRRPNPAACAAPDSTSRQQQYFDAPPCYYPGHYQAGPVPEKVMPMEFTERRGSPQERQHQQLQQGQAQVLLANNSATSPLPCGYYNNNHQQTAYDYGSDLKTAPELANTYAGSAPPSQYDNWRQQRRQQGFVEPDEVSNATFDAPSGRRTGLFDTLAQQAGNLRDGKGKDLFGKLLSR
ncbi:hypothetical protein AYL99_02074 [Fonsecaea erecta]|uniref:Uncharacterized protein n=1 Tax=Fonsecaea erecta TaxID=1367422 RepID=A0A178ZSR3_9EURO|nr:hypothetical protein AYL99_02074 [Fonsecaea erecta]OAP62847.1 hypothetical protein AYL99_02074 [Fonsecaea erecta]